LVTCWCLWARMRRRGRGNEFLRGSLGSLWEPSGALWSRFNSFCELLGLKTSKLHIFPFWLRGKTFGRKFPPQKFSLCFVLLTLNIQFLNVTLSVNNREKNSPQDRLRDVWKSFGVSWAQKSRRKRKAREK
jgi:hypothetical protein